MNKQDYQNRIAELLAQGRSARYAESVAKHERRLASPAHRAAVARRLVHADIRAERTGDVSAFNVCEFN